MTTAPFPPPPRRWFRFSLRTFFLLVTIVCLVLGLYVKRELDRQAAIETIKNGGGVVLFASQTPASMPATLLERLKFAPVPSSRAEDALFRRMRTGIVAAPPPAYFSTEPQGKTWKRRTFGAYAGSQVYSVALRWPSYGPPDAAVDVGALRTLAEIRELELHAPIDDAALARLPRLENVVALNLSSRGLVTDKGLRYLARLPGLKAVQISDGVFTSSGLRHFTQWQQLTHLKLLSCDLSDDSPQPLAELPRLTDLSLQGCSIGDAAIPHLAKLRNLTVLDLTATHVSEEGRDRLREALPGCTIVP